jgi:hypothetical protein
VIQERHEPDDERGHATIAGAVPYRTSLPCGTADQSRTLTSRHTASG